LTTKPLDDDPTQYDDDTDTRTKRSDVEQWRCLNCGQHIFVVIDTDPPDICEYCKDMTTWEHTHKT